MRQRVAELGGTIEISSTPGSGTKVIAFLPVGRDDAPPREA
jgi:signal transduction histidine kinase